jgi:succinate dehydrogenase / fumarate reductase, cytochrome b subunit
MRKTRPVNLNLFTIRFPATAISSILHRISGVLLFIFLFFLMWSFSCSLKSPDCFEGVKTCFSHPLCKFFIWVFLSSLIFHLVAGIRHLLMDMGLGEERQSGRVGAYLVMIISAILIVLLGISLW